MSQRIAWWETTPDPATSGVRSTVSVMVKEKHRRRTVGFSSELVPKAPRLPFPAGPHLISAAAEGMSLGEQPLLQRVCLLSPERGRGTGKPLRLAPLLMGQ